VTEGRPNPLDAVIPPETQHKKQQGSD
jgi:hypothetical protein